MVSGTTPLDRASSPPPGSPGACLPPAPKGATCARALEPSLLDCGSPLGPHDSCARFCLGSAGPGSVASGPSLGEASATWGAAHSMSEASATWGHSVGSLGSSAPGTPVVRAGGSAAHPGDVAPGHGPSALGPHAAEHARSGGKLLREPSDTSAGSSGSSTPSARGVSLPGRDASVEDRASRAAAASSDSSSPPASASVSVVEVPSAGDVDASGADSISSSKAAAYGGCGLAAVDVGACADASAAPPARSAHLTVRLPEPELSGASRTSLAADGETPFVARSAPAPAAEAPPSTPAGACLSPASRAARGMPPAAPLVVLPEGTARSTPGSRTASPTGRGPSSRAPSPDGRSRGWGDVGAGGLMGPFGSPNGRTSQAQAAAAAMACGGSFSSYAGRPAAGRSRPGGTSGPSPALSQSSTPGWGSPPRQPTVSAQEGRRIAATMLAAQVPQHSSMAVAVAAAAAATAVAAYPARVNLRGSRADASQPGSAAQSPTHATPGSISPSHTPFAAHPFDAPAEAFSTAAVAAQGAQGWGGDGASGLACGAPLPGPAHHRSSHSFTQGNRPASVVGGSAFAPSLRVELPSHARSAPASPVRAAPGSFAQQGPAAAQPSPAPPASSADPLHHIVELAGLMQSFGLLPAGPPSSPSRGHRPHVPKYNPDGTVRLNARQRRTLRRAHERAVNALAAAAAVATKGGRDGAAAAARGGPASGSGPGPAELAQLGIQGLDDIKQIAQGLSTGGADPASSAAAAGAFAGAASSEAAFAEPPRRAQIRASGLAPTAAPFQTTAGPSGQNPPAPAQLFSDLASFSGALDTEFCIGHMDQILSCSAMAMAENEGSDGDVSLSASVGPASRASSLTLGAGQALGAGLGGPFGNGLSASMSAASEYGALAMNAGGSLRGPQQLGAAGGYGTPAQHHGAGLAHSASASAFAGPGLRGTSFSGGFASQTLSLGLQGSVSSSTSSAAALLRSHGLGSQQLSFSPMPSTSDLQSTNLSVTGLSATGLSNASLSAPQRLSSTPFPAPQGLSPPSLSAQSSVATPGLAPLGLSAPGLSAAQALGPAHAPAHQHLPGLHQTHSLPLPHGHHRSQSLSAAAPAAGGSRPLDHGASFSSDLSRSFATSLGLDPSSASFVAGGQGGLGLGQAYAEGSGRYASMVAASQAGLPPAASLPSQQSLASTHVPSLPRLDSAVPNDLDDLHFSVETARRLGIFECEAFGAGDAARDLAGSREAVSASAPVSPERRAAGLQGHRDGTLGADRRALFSQPSGVAASEASQAAAAAQLLSASLGAPQAPYQPALREELQVAFSHPSGRHSPQTSFSSAHHSPQTSFSAAYLQPDALFHHPPCPNASTSGETVATPVETRSSGDTSLEATLASLALAQRGGDGAPADASGPLRAF